MWRVLRRQPAAPGALAAFALLLPGPVAAERVVLAPSGLVAAPSSASVEAAFRDRSTSQRIGWLTLGAPSSDLGLEIEAEDVDMARRRTDLSAQFSFTGNALVDVAPTLTCGVRDALNSGRFRRSYYVAAGKAFGLSQSQERLVRRLEVHAGLGSGRMEGPFVGVRARLALGPVVSAEYVRRSFNASAALPILRGVEVRAYTLDGDLYWGARVSFAR